MTDAPEISYIKCIKHYRHKPSYTEIPVKAHCTHILNSDWTVWTELYHMDALLRQWRQHKNKPSQKKGINFITVRDISFICNQSSRGFLPLMPWSLVCLGITLNRLVKWCVITAMILSFQL